MERELWFSGVSPAAMASIQTALSALEECAQEYCTVLRQVKSQPELFDCIRTLCGFPASSAETVELIEILQTEQALLHSAMSQHPGNPSKADLALNTKLKTTTDLLSLMHESTQHAGFPNKGAKLLPSLLVTRSTLPSTK